MQADAEDNHHVNNEACDGIESHLDFSLDSNDANILPSTSATMAKSTEAPLVVYTIQAALPAPYSGTTQPMAIHIARGWKATGQVTLHLQEGRTIRCQHGPIRGEETQKIALCVHREWVPTRDPILVHFDEHNMIRYHWPDERKGLADRVTNVLRSWTGATGRNSWARLTLDILKLSILIGLLALLLFIPPDEDQIPSSSAAQNTTIASSFGFFFTSMWNTYPLAILPLITPSPTDPFLILNPGHHLTPLSIELSQLCMSLRYLSPPDTEPILACNDTGASFHLREANMLAGKIYRQISGRPSYWVQQVESQLQELAWNLFHMSGNEGMISLKSLGELLQVALDEIRNKHDAIASLLDKYEGHLTVAKQLEQDHLLPELHRLLDTHAGSTELSYLDAVDALQYCTVIAFPARDVLLQRVKTAMEELVFVKSMMNEADELLATTLHDKRAWKQSVNVTGLIYTLADSVFFIHKTNEDVRQTRERFRDACKDEKRPLRPSDVERERREKQRRASWWSKWNSGAKKPTRIGPWEDKLRGMKPIFKVDQYLKFGHDTEEEEAGEE